MRFLAVICLLAGPLLSACAQPNPLSMVSAFDRTSDVRVCRRLGEVSPVVSTQGGFGQRFDAMRAETLRRGGTDIHLFRHTRDWSQAGGVAYRCPFPEPR